MSNEADRDPFLAPLVVAAVIFLALMAVSLKNRMQTIPGTDATRADVIAMLEECERDLPRNQRCVIDISPRVDTNPYVPREE